MKTTRGRIWNRSVTSSVPLVSAWLLFLGLSHPSERLSPLGLWTSSIEGMLPVGLPSFRQSMGLSCVQLASESSPPTSGLHL